jgi:hypothetical protein
MKKLFYQQSFTFKSEDFESIITEDEILNSKADQIIEGFIDNLFETKQLVTSIQYLSPGNGLIIAVLMFRDMTDQEKNAALQSRAEKSGIVLKMPS